MADSPGRIRTPWLRDEVADAAGDVEIQRLGVEASGSPVGGMLRKLLCRGVAALGVVGAACLATGHQVARAVDVTEYELVFEGEVPQGENFTLHVGSVCFGATPFAGSPGQAPLVGGVMLEVELDQEWRAIYGPREEPVPYVDEIRERQPVWKAVNKLNRMDLQGPEFYTVQVPEFNQSSGRPLFGLDGVGRLSRTGHVVAWGERVRGTVTEDGKWLRVLGRGFLPMKVGGVSTLQRQKEAFIVDNIHLRAPGAVLFFHNSQRQNDHNPSSFALWGEVVRGYVTPDGTFLFVPGRGLLPMEVNGLPTLRRIHVAVATVDGDWLTRNGTLVHIQGHAITRFGRNPNDTWTGALEHDGNGTYYAAFEGVTLSAELVRDTLAWSDQDAWVKVAAASSDRAPDPSGAHGEMVLLLFDDREAHWGRAAKAFSSSTVEEKKKVANLMTSFRPPQLPERNSVAREVKIREGVAHHWHIALVGADVKVEGRPRYRVWAKSQLSSGAPGDFNPERCPGQPTVWMQRKARQMFEYIRT